MKTLSFQVFWVLNTPPHRLRFHSDASVFQQGPSAGLGSDSRKKRIGQSRRLVYP